MFDPKQEIAFWIDENTESRVLSHTNPTKACESALKAARHGDNGVLILEELMTVRPVHYATITEMVAVRRTSTQGNGVFMVGTSQRPAIMPISFKAAADVWICGQITDSDDLKSIEKVATREFSDTLPGLKRGEWMVYTFGKQEPFLMVSEDI